MRVLACFAGICAAAFAVEPLPILGISHVNFRVSDLNRARQFYGGLLGYESAFQFDKPDGSGPSLLFYKVNDDQFIEISPGLPPNEDRRMTHVSFQVSDAPKVRDLLISRGLSPTAITEGRDRNRAFRLNDPEGNILEFTEYLPGGMHAEARGKSNGPNRISSHLLHAGIVITNVDQALKFYRDLLGFQEFWRGGPTDGETKWINMRTPGTRGDYVELMITAPNPPRNALGSMQHDCLEVEDIHKAHDALAGRAGDWKIGDTRVGRNQKWQLNLFDQDGSRTELMEPRTTTAQPAPASNGDGPQPRVVSPGDASHPPSDAVVLFDGTTVAKWMTLDGKPSRCTASNGAMVCVSGVGDQYSTEKFRSAQIHLEFAPPLMADQHGQMRGNSGVYLHGKYEIQILDSYNNPTYANGALGALYGQSAPLVNAARPPEQWQTYDIIFHGPQCDTAGAVTQKGTVTVLLNGVLVQDHVSIDKSSGCDAGPLMLQDHSGFKDAPVTAMKFRNVWFRRLE